MDNRRIETAPAWLVTLAACALVMSWAVTREWSKPTGRVAVDPPRRSQAPLRWPIAELRPLPVAELAAAASSSLAPAETIRIAAPRLTPPALSGPSEADLLAIAPLRAAAEASLLVLLPQEPAWRVGDSGPVVVSAKARRAWSIASVDTLALARRLGRKLAEPFDTLAEARVALANTPVAWIDAPGEAPVRRVAAVGPVLRSAAPARTVRVIPVESRDATPQRLIVDYLLEADTRAFPVAEALGEQLDRVARDAGLAPWAWDVAFRLRRLAESRADDPAAAAALRALERQTGEALARSETLGDAPVATELRRAAYGLTRRTDAWRAAQVLRRHVTADDHSAVVPGDR